MELYKENGIWKVSFVGKNGRTQHRSTKTSSREEAEAVVKQAKIAELELAAKAKSLNAESLTAIMAGRKVSTKAAIIEWGLLCARDLSANTATNRYLVVNQWTRESGLTENSPIASLVTYEKMDAFVNEKSAGMATRSMRMACLRSFASFCSARAYIVGDPGKLLKIRIKGMTHEQRESEPRKPVTEEEYNKLVATVDGFWKHAITLSYWTGLRLSDICCLEWASIDADAITLWTQKTETRVQVPLSEPLIGGGQLNSTILEMTMDSGGGAYCFPEQRDVILDPKKRAKLSVYAGRVFSRAGVKGKTFHCLRHSFVTRLHKAGKSLQEIGKVVGHSNTKTTEGYSHHEPTPEQHRVPPRPLPLHPHR